MRYMLLIYSDPKVWESVDAATQEAINGEYYAFTQTIVDSKEFAAGDPLQGGDTATTVRVQNGKRVTADGPFAETKEVLGGYYIVDVPHLDRAVEIAAEIPGAKRGLDSIEVRPIMELPGM